MLFVRVSKKLAHFEQDEIEMGGKTGKTDIILLAGKNWCLMKMTLSKQHFGLRFTTRILARFSKK